jgi:hypothetical protein
MSLTVADLAHHMPWADPITKTARGCDARAEVRLGVVLRTRHGRLCAHAPNPTMHRTTAANTATFNTASIIRAAQFPSLQKVLGLIERETLCARRWHDINGTSSVKQSPTFWTANSNRPASERIGASRSLCSCVALGMRDHPQLDDQIVESRRANQRRRSIPDCKFEIPHERCPLTWINVPTAMVLLRLCAAPL